MEFNKYICHTASIPKNYKELNRLFTINFFNIIEFDIRFRNNELYWEHEKKENKLGICLKDILDYNKFSKSKKDIILDFKGIKRKDYQDEDYLLSILKSINDYCFNVSIQSINISFIRIVNRLVIKYNLKNIKVGFVINYFTSFMVPIDRIVNEIELDYISLANEVWLYRLNFINKLKKNNLKLYAWFWDLLYKEKQEVVKLFINNGADCVLISPKNSDFINNIID